MPSNLIHAEADKVITGGKFGIPLVDGGIKSFVLKGNNYHGFISNYTDYGNYSETFILSYNSIEFSLSFDPEIFGIEWGGLRKVKWANGGILKNHEEYRDFVFTGKTNNYIIPKTFNDPLPDKINIKNGSFKNQWKDGSPKVGFIPFGVFDQREEEYSEVPLGFSVQSEDEHMNL